MPMTAREPESRTLTAVEWGILHRITRTLTDALERQHEAERRALRNLLDYVAGHLRREGYDEETAAEPLPEHLAGIAAMLRSTWARDPEVQADWHTRDADEAHAHYAYAVAFGRFSLEAAALLEEEARRLGMREG